MLQPYTDWELLESQKYPDYQYSIFKLVDTEGKTLLKGWVFAIRGTTWLVSNDIGNLRAGLCSNGRQMA